MKESHIRWNVNYLVATTVQAKKPLFNKFFRAILSQSDTAVRQAKDRKREMPKCEITLLSAARFVEVGVLWGFMRSLRSRLDTVTNEICSISNLNV